ncbi:MAG: serine/threonine-protein phosphatase, partial [Chlamydiia bacterium]|nr:serine/threonine-protein phosphatase [Chlamydiia bacterium]
MNRFAFRLTSFGLSDIGHIRKNNEDVFHSLKELGFFALADGMGGHNAGEVAAKEAVKFVSASVEELFASSKKDWNIFDLSSFNKICIENANSWVHHLGNKKKAYSGMGTTLCTLLFHERSLIYGHVGDSRIYRFR